MPQTIRFHLDENVSHAIAEGLRRLEIDVTTTPEARLMGRPDEQHVTFAIQQERVIFTQDADFLRIDSAGISHNGIVYCRQNSRSIGQIVRGLIFIWEYLDLENMRGRVEFI